MGVVGIKPPPTPAVLRGRTPSPKGGTTNFDEPRPPRSTTWRGGGRL